MTIGSLPGVVDLWDRFANFRYSLFRLEALQVYGGSGEDETLAAFRAGEPIPLSPALRKWTQMLRQRVSSGCTVQRVHVITSPVSDYIRFELASYAPNVEAGEDVRIIPTPSGGPWPADVPRDDFWLIDSSELWSQRYDQEGTWLGVERVTDTGQIVTACRARDAALHHSRPWADYLRDNHPEITSYLAITADQS
ncbi:MAG: DUF6879 family protein [Pseudonocardiaceae bacterium]